MEKGLIAFALITLLFSCKKESNTTSSPTSGTSSTASIGTNSVSISTCRGTYTYTYPGSQTFSPPSSWSYGTKTTFTIPYQNANPSYPSFNMETSLVTLGTDSIRYNGTDAISMRLDTSMVCATSSTQNFIIYGFNSSYSGSGNYIKITKYDPKDGTIDGDYKMKLVSSSLDSIRIQGHFSTKRIQ